MSTLPLRRQSNSPLAGRFQATPIGTVNQDEQEYPVLAAIVNITPAIATMLLTYLGTIQRKVKTAHFASLNRDMNNGRFVFTGEPIIFSEDDALLDGQHRLKSCINTETSFTAIVVFGVPSSSFRAMNVTAKRSGADTLRIAGHKNVACLSAVASWIYRWEHEKLLETFALTPTEIEDIITNHPNVYESISKADHAWRQLRCGKAFATFCHYIFSAIDAEDSNAFFEQLGTDVGHEQGSPILALRRLFLERKNFRTGGRQMIVAFFKAWNLFRKSKTVRSISARIDEDIPKII